MNDEISQILGKALGYPYFCDDKKNFTEAVESDGVCVGDHVAESLAIEAANRLEAAEKDAARINWMEATPEHYLRKYKRHWYCTLRQEEANGYPTIREAIDAKMEDEKC